MKIEINFGILVVIGVFVTVVLISIPKVFNSFAFGFFIGIIVTTGIYLLRKSIVYDTKKRKIKRLNKNETN